MARSTTPTKKTTRSFCSPWCVRRCSCYLRSDFIWTDPVPGLGTVGRIIADRQPRSLVKMLWLSRRDYGEDTAADDDDEAATAVGNGMEYS